MLTARKISRLNAKIQKNWPKLSDEEINSYHAQPEDFYTAVRKKYGMFKQDIEKRVQEFKSEIRFFNW